METLKFEWDPNKNETNKKKHGLSFETAKEVFYDEFAILFDDPDHSDDEERFLIIGETKAEQICIVSLATVTMKMLFVLFRQEEQPELSRGLTLMEFEVIL